jgi:hypothetical protein
VNILFKAISQVEDSWLYQEVIDKGLQQALQEAAMSVLKTRFPELEQFAAEIIETVRRNGIIVYPVPPSNKPFPKTKNGQKAKPDQTLEILIAPVLIYFLFLFYQ